MREVSGTEEERERRLASKKSLELKGRKRRDL